MKQKPEDLFRKAGGRLHMNEAVKKGISRYMLYSLLEKGIVEKVSRGVYRLSDLPPLGSPDLVTVSLRFSNAVICLVSALAFHDITTQIPHEIWVAVPTGTRRPRLDYPPIRSHTFSGASYTFGIENHVIDGINVKIYSAEKTLADCFKFRNKVGMDIALEALKLYKTRRKVDYQQIITYAKACRVEKIMLPYLEGIL